jgi:4-aminobutyrate aminotransferase/4-aminobutyrate aminotransferase/(S)-3-amino-2-methylpropionate transaminase
MQETTIPRSLTKAEVIALQEKFVVPSVKATLDIVFVKGRGTKLWDNEGKEYVDCLGGLAVANVGHCHPKVVEAVRAQLDQLTHVSTLFYSEPMVRLAEKLSKIVPINGPTKSFFCNSGTEANEHALTLAKKHTGHTEVVGLQGGFYGRGGQTLSVTGVGTWRVGLGPFIPGTLHAPSYHCYRCPMGYKNGPRESNYACAHYLEKMLKTEVSQPPAAFIAEPIQGVAGAIPAPPDYFKIIKEILDENGILFIVDEVQTGFGRTGKMFGIEHYGVKADIVSMAKSIGGGLPLGALSARSDVADSYPGPDFSTFGGNPLSCVASLAAIEVIENEHLVENARSVGENVKARFAELSARSSRVDDVQGRGLLISLEIVEDKDARKPASPDFVLKVVQRVAERGVIVGRGGQYQNRLRFSPPLCITQEEADHCVSIIEDCIQSAA